MAQAPSGPITLPGSQTAQSEQPIPFSIAPQPLVDALEKLSDQSGLSFAYTTDQLTGVASPGVNGTMTAEQALRSLLAGTGVSYQFTANSTITLTRPTNDQEGGPITLSPIVVQGERRPKSLQNSTTSVSVFNEAAIEQSDENRVYGVVNQAPNVTPVPVPGEFLPPIRGVQSDGGGGGLGGNFLFGTQPRASLIVDDVARPSTTANSAFQSTFDVEQVEVLRGPQTTLRGANAIAGAYIVKTKDPQFATEAEAQAGVDWDEFSKFGYQLAGMANAPLIEDQVAGRMVVDFQDGKIPVRVVDPGGTAPPGTDLSQLSEFDNVSLRGKVLVEPNALPNLSVTVTGEYENGKDPIFDSFINGSDLTGDPTEDRNTIASNGVVVDTSAYAFSLNGAYELADGLELRSISSYQNDKFESADDSIGSFMFENSEFRRFNQDLLLVFDNLSDRLSGVAGITFEDESEETVEQSFVLNSRGDRTTVGLFGDLEIGITDRLNLLAGGRVQYTDFDFDLSFFGGLGSLDFSDNETVVLPKVGLGYDFTDNQTVFVTATRGYNPGGAGVSFVTGQPFTYESEFVWTFEAGYRGTFMEDRLGLSANIFYNNYDDYQFLFSPQPFDSQIVNFDGQSYGLELEGRAQIVDSLNATLGLGLLHTQIDASGETIDGNRFGLDPKVTLSGGLTWEPISDLFFNARAQYVSEYYGDFTEAPGTESGNYVMLDLGVDYTIGPVTMRAFIQNVTDKFAYFQRTTAGGDGYVLAPRTFGALVNIKF